MTTYTVDAIGPDGTTKVFTARATSITRARFILYQQACAAFGVTAANVQLVNQREVTPMVIMNRPTQIIKAWGEDAEQEVNYAVEMTNSPEITSVADLADALRDNFCDYRPESPLADLDAVHLDLLEWAVEHVDFKAIATAYWTDYRGKDSI